MQISYTLHNLTKLQLSQFQINPAKSTQHVGSVIHAKMLVNFVATIWFFKPFKDI